MYQLVLMFHVLAAVFLIALVLVQQGKGATMGAGFGGGASQTVFGSRGSGSFLLKLTIGFVIFFFATSLILNYLANQAVRQPAPLNLPVQLPGTAPLQDTSAAAEKVIPSAIPPAQPVDQASKPKK